MSEHMTTFSELLEALNATGIPFTAFAWATPPGDVSDAWGVIAIDGGQSLAGDNTHAEEVLEGTIDLFTRRLAADDMQAVAGCLKGLDVCYRLNSVQYEQDTRLIHYEWVWQSAAPARFE